MSVRVSHLMIGRLLIGGAVLLAVALGVPLSWAQDAKEREIQELRQRLDRLEKEIGVKKEAPPPPAAAPAEPPKSVGDRIKALEETIKSTPILSVIKDWNFGGHVAVSYNYNFNNPDSRSNNAAGNQFYRVFDDRANSFLLNQAELWMDKPTSAESPIGFGVDVLIGRDAKKVHALGLGANAADFSDLSKTDPFDLTQAYVTYKAPLGAGLDFKAGKFITVFGNEVIRRTGNFHISRSIQFGNAIPFTHVGVLASYPVLPDIATATVGIVNGWDNADDNNTDKSYIGQVSATPIKDLTLTLGGMWGPEFRFTAPTLDTANGPKRGLLDFIASYKPIPPLTLAVNYDYGTQDEAFGPGTVRATWHAISAYGVFDVTDKLAIGLRGEYFIDNDGFRLGLDPNTGRPFDVWELTLTARYKLFDHLFASIEYRHDQATNGANVFDDAGKPASTNSEDTIAVELVYQF